MLQSLFLWIYRMDFHEVLILLAVCTGLFYAVYVRFHSRRFWMAAVITLLLIWAAAVVAQTVLLRTPTSNQMLSLQPFRSYLDVLNDRSQIELLRSNFMNALLFYPAGLLLTAILPTRWKPILRMLVIGVFAVVFSTVIEFMQFHNCLGLAQTDDVIHAVLGAWIGTAVTCLLQLFSSQRIYKK